MAPAPRDGSATLDTNTVSRALASVTDLARAFDALWDAVWTQPHVSASVLELCRLRIAQMHGAATELAIRNPQAQQTGIGEKKIQTLLAARSAAGKLFTDAERAALELAELHAMDPAAITDELAGEVKVHFGEKGLVALIEALGFIDARIRVSCMLPQLGVVPRP